MNIGAAEIFVIIVFALLILGPDRLPKFGETLGKAINQFKQAEKKVNEGLKVEGINPKEIKEVVDNPFLAMEKHEKAKQRAEAKAEREKAKAEKAATTTDVVTAAAAGTATAKAKLEAGNASTETVDTGSAEPVEDKVAAQETVDTATAAATVATDAKPENAPAAAAVEEPVDTRSIAEAVRDAKPSKSAGSADSADSSGPKDSEQDSKPEKPPVEVYPEVEMPAATLAEGAFDTEPAKRETFAERKERLAAQKQAREEEHGDAVAEAAVVSSDVSRGGEGVPEPEAL